MASPQKENGFTPIANEIMERLAFAKLNGCQYAIIITILRFTYGFQRKEHDLSLSFISSATGFDKRQIQRELKNLELKKIIKQKVSNGISRTVSFNKDFEQWDPHLTYGKKTNGEITNGGNTVGDTANSPKEPTVNSPTKKENKDKTKESVPYSEIIGYLNQKTGKNFSSKTEATIKFINGRWEEDRRLEDFKQVIDVKCKDWLGKKDQEGRSMEMYLRPKTLFSPTNFENYLNQCKDKPKKQPIQITIVETDYLGE